MQTLPLTTRPPRSGLSPLALSPLLAAALAWHAPASAQPAGPAAAPSSWSLGVSAIGTHKPYAGIDRDYLPLPLIGYESERLSIAGPQIGLKLLRTDPRAAHQVGIDLIARYDVSGYDDDDIEDTPILRGMDEREGGVWAGARIEWNSGWGKVGAAVLADASSKSEGHRVELGIEKTWQIGSRMTLTPRLGATWHDRKSVDYYYGVRANEARAGRAAYLGRSGVNAEAGVRALYLFDRRHAAFVDAGVTRLASEITDSPLVDRSTENRVLLGYLYRFR